MKYLILQWFPLKKRNSILILLLLTIFSNADAFTIPKSDSVFSREITDLIMMCQFDSAIELIDNYREKEPANPLPLILKLTVLGMRDVDLEMTVDSALFKKTYEIALEKIESMEKKHGVTSYSRTLLGFSKATFASFYVRKKMYFAGLQTGTESIKILREAKEMDSTNTDVDFFLGLYNYGKTELRKKMWMVMFWYGGDKKEGIELLENCSKTAYITRNAALSSLTDIYTAEKMYKNSEMLIDVQSRKFPESRFVYWSQAKLYESQKKYSEAAAIYNKLSLQYSTVKNGAYNSLYTKKSEAQMYYEAGMKSLVGPICRTILENPKLADKTLRKETKKLLESIDES